MRDLLPRESLGSVTARMSSAIGVGGSLAMLGVLIAVFPFYWIVVMATNTSQDIYSYPRNCGSAAVC